MISYYTSNGLTQEGPFALYELKEKKLTGASLIWHQGLDGWQPASAVPEVAELLTTQATPPPLPFTTPPPAPAMAGTDGEPAYRFNTFGPSNSSQPIVAAEPKGKTGKIALFSLAGLLLVFFAYTWYMNNVHYPEQEAKTQAFIEQMEREREEEIERKAEERRKYIRNNFSSFIIPQASSYTYYEIGGIENLSVTLHNQSEYRLSKVIVTIDYIKSSGGIYKSEELVFSGIKAKSETTLKAPDSSRGTKVNCYVTYVYSDKLNMEYNYYTGTTNQAGEDPFRLK